jgi:exopolysaccharide biosynthesis polyprenyl glycosylphosphotransferase
LKGYFDESPSSNMDRYCTYLGRPEIIEPYIKQHNIHEMIIALEKHEHEKLLKIIGQYNLYDICIKIIPDMYEAISGQVRIDTIKGLPLLNINADIKTEFQEVIKRMGDIFLSIFGLIFLLPIIIIIAGLVRISSKGDVFYRQIRVGLNGINFTLLKFRTMNVGSEDQTGPIWSMKEDPRTTNIGKRLRRYHLDEIPQLLNVFYGHMSIIGPRPERPEIIESLIKEVPYYSHRLKVKPGVTGWAQVKGLYDSNITDVKSKLKLDFYYIENMSILLDLKIIFITIIIVLKGKGR